MKRTIHLVLVFAGIASSLLAMQPPRPGEIERLKERGQYEARLAFALEKGNHLLRWDAPGVRSAGFRGLPTQGTVVMPVLLIEFPDYKHTIASTVITGAYFGQGNADYFPYESLREYYKRSSYGKLDIQGTVYGWYTAENPRDWYTNDAEGLIEEALAHFDAQGADFAPFDNNGDGMIDYLSVYWTGPDTGWGNFWWGWNGWFGDSDYTIDGKHLGNFSWMWEEPYASTVIHETGHSLGLPDYYDYDGSVGPDGGVGGLDIMDGGGDHNGFSKWVLGWLTPQVVTGSLAGVNLPPASQQPSAVVLAAGTDPSSPFQEYVIVQNRSRLGNDAGMPADGLLVFHVDARRGCGGGFLYDNSYTEHKLLKVLEADGNESIESGGWGSGDDFYTAANAKTLTPLTVPSTDLYSGRTSGAWMTSLVALGKTYAADFKVEMPPSLLPPVTLLEPADGAIGVAENPTVRWDPVPGNNGYALDLYWDTQPVYRTTAAKDRTSAALPATVVMPTGSHSVRVKALGDGAASGTGDFARSHFVVGCAGDAAWLTRTFPEPPCNVWVPAVAFDPSTGRTVMFGGSNGTTTFEYDGEAWHAYEASPAPPYRWYAAMAYDPVNRGVLLFGGYNYDTGQTYGDTWLYSARTHTWTEISAPGPWPDWAAKMAADPVRNRVVLYEPGYTWEWDGTAWSEVYDAQTPWVWYTDLAYDAGAGTMVLFGGDNGAMSGETWVFEAGAWTLRLPASSPGPRFWGELYSDAYTGRVMLFGGDDGTSALSDSWEWDGAAWSEVEACTFVPLGLWPPMGDYDARRAVFVVTSNGNPVYELALPGEEPSGSAHGRPLGAP
jgi:M6 family metalloprotease-like protein